MDDFERREKRWNRRRAYLEDFQLNVAGEYVYTGKVHHFCAEDGLTRRRAMTVLWALALLMAVLTVVSGCLPAAGMQHTFYGLIPYAGGLLSVVSVIWALARLSTEGEPVRDFIYKATIEQFRPRSALAAAFTAATLAAETVHLILIRGAGVNWPGTITFLVLQGVILAAAIAWRGYAVGLHWSVNQPDT